ncbi:O-antigen ligase family protein [Bacillus sp. Marseille-Q1617]|uniref:O-antigen ligase family protein n=1 Tax=Bacillus sp. Marseille-Q1617 TaxID=2736887 RepID=UPI00158CC08C|nr:O-antigen ligase family protein [Bacillus sp. Marseille-Q1617]
MRKDKLISTLMGISIFGIVFGGALKTIPFLGLGSIINLAFLLLITVLAVFQGKGSINFESKMVFGLLFICCVYVLYSIFVYSHEEEYLKYLIKFIGMTYAIIIIAVFAKKEDINSFINFTLVIALILLVFDLSGLKAVGDDVNYLTRPHLYGAATCVLMVKALNSIKQFFVNSILIILYIYVIIDYGSRGPLLFIGFTFILIAILFSKNRVRNTIFLLIISVIVKFNIETILESNQLLVYRFNRLFYSIEEEPRFQLYSKTIEYILNNPLGYGFYAHKTLIGEKYVESFPLEMLLNFGIITFILFLYLLVRLLRYVINHLGDTSKISLFTIFIYLLLSFSRSWSFSDGMVLFIIYLLIFIKNKKGDNNVLGNNSYS